MANKFNISDVMISYSRDDKAFVQKLEAGIAKTGRETWVDWDDIDPSINWWEEIKSGIEAAHIFLFVISPNSIESSVCHDEISYAVANNKRIVPIVYQDIVDVETKEKMHSALSSHNWIMYRQEDDQETAFKTLLKALETDFEHVQEHTRLLVRATEWDDSNRPKYLLLHGDDVKNADKWLQDAYTKDPKPIDLQIDYISKSRKAVTTGRWRSLALIMWFTLMLVACVGIFVLGQRSQSVLLDYMGWRESRNEATNEYLIGKINDLVTYAPADIQTEVADDLATFEANIPPPTPTAQP